VQNISKIALRNLFRYKRRTLLTISLIIIGVVFMLVYVSVSGSFKNMIIGQITDSMMGHIQIHSKGYVASIDNLPLDLNMSEKNMETLGRVLNEDRAISSFSRRIKFGGMLSNYAETTNIRINGILPEEEFKTVPLLTSRIVEGRKELRRGEIFVPILLAKGMNLKIGTTVVIVATNYDGSVNAKKLVVAGVLENVAGPLGRDGYIHFEDAQEILRMKKPEISEVVIRLRDYGTLHNSENRLKEKLNGQLNKKGKPLFEVHGWDELHPFARVAQMVDLMTFFTTLMLVAIVLISILNVMTMAVYERMREIGTIIALGTLPEKISLLFLLEGLYLGIASVIAGNVLSIALIIILTHMKLTFSFGGVNGMILLPHINELEFLRISALVIFVSAIASLQPAMKASRLDPINAFRQI
jgi:putative ABC transport system permease protein